MASLPTTFASLPMVVGALPSAVDWRRNVTKVQALRNFYLKLLHILKYEKVNYAHLKAALMPEIVACEEAGATAVELDQVALSTFEEFFRDHHGRTTQ